ncbi:MAB_1171c family putative transporter [Nocardia araoensis]|uniref:MAB_1171c family putative transporter n=1 Tax=Nocardia araoensis TaxID=228600 RepID=UPI0002DB2E63|nr:MAB_1171c family putative transporter [Nocardia araoensis]
MSSSIPGIVAWPIIGFVAAVAAGRWLLVRDTIVDRLLNQLFGWGVLSLLLYRCDLTPGIASLAHQLSLGCTVMSSMCLQGIVRIWAFGADPDPDEVRRRHRVCYLLAAASTAAILLAGTSARREGRLVDLTPDIEGLVVWTAFGLPLLVNVALLAHMCVRELRDGGIGLATKLVCGLLIWAATLFGGNLALTTVYVVTGWQPMGTHMVRMEATVTLCLGVDAMLVAIPLVRTLLAIAQLDRAGRLRRRLRPLWRDLTTAVPEIVLRPDAGELADPETRLIRMTVEIQDALLQLGRYAPASAMAGSGCPLTDYAHQVACAALARETGSAPIGSSQARLPVPAADFDAELRQLLDLARVWPAARAAAGGRVPVAVGAG